MKIISNKKGVTIIMLVITIIVLLLLTTLAIFYSNNIAPESQIAVAYSSLREIKRACEEAEHSVLINPDKYDEYDFFGKTIFEDGSDVNEIATRCGLTGENDFKHDEDGELVPNKVYMIIPLKDDNESGDIRRRIRALDLSRVTGYYIVDLTTDSYYVLDGVKRKDGDYPNDKLYEYREIQRMYEMLTKSEK